jgi:hypothetical protein
MKEGTICGTCNTYKNAHKILVGRHEVRAKHKREENTNMNLKNREIMTRDEDLRQALVNITIKYGFHRVEGNLIICVI